ncbi:MAG: hypothetical protein QOD74_2336 [Variibacter sp.]|nr:hypothetical protein [Variibacter sp.]
MRIKTTGRFFGARFVEQAVRLRTPVNDPVLLRARFLLTFLGSFARLAQTNDHGHGGPFPCLRAVDPAGEPSHTS